MREELFLDSALISRNHDRETLCGDFSQMFGTDTEPVFVLSDGMGSGVKANILATLTCTILGRLLEHGIPLAECVDTIAATLPVCRERHMAYATFTAMQISGDRAFLVEYDNPPAIVIRNGQVLKSSCNVRFVGDKEIHQRQFDIMPGDVIVLMSDGVTHSGIGRTNDDGWTTAEAGEFLIENGAAENCAAVTAAILDKKCARLSKDALDDDRTIAVMRFCQRTTVNLMMGPPENSKDDERMLKLFFAKKGQHVVCGGSTGTMVSRYLNKPIELVEGSGSERVPDMAKLEGVDLLTEGIITLKAALDLRERIKEKPELILELRESPEELLYKKLFLESSNVNIFFGTAANAAHKDIGISFEKKLEAIKKLYSELLAAGKTVKKEYF